MPEWDAEVVVDEALVRALLLEQFPELDASSARPIGEGWDNSVWVVEDRWVFRFPRREIAIAGLRREIDVLPQLAPLLPVPIPAPCFVGRPSERFRWPFFGAPLLGGCEPAEACLTDVDRSRLGVGVARFLRALHAPQTLASVDPERALPVDFNRRADMPFRVAMTRERLDAVTELAPPATRAAAEQVLADAEVLPPSTTTVLLHGDLHVRHVLVEHGELSGVIDWGDVCVGDPSVDLLFVWSVLPPEAREVFFDEYGRVDDATRLRAQVLGIMLSAVLTLYARDQRLPALEREARAGIERAAVG